MNTRQLKYVLALDREGSFSRAADSLNITQPSFSQYIKKIEKELNVVLFDRSGAEVRLTEAGRVYVETGQKILDLELQMENRFADMSIYKTGSLRVGISPHRSVWFMPEVTARFKEKYPGIHMVIDERVGRELIDGAERGEFDLCITPLPVNEKVFNYERIHHEEVLVAVPLGSDLYIKLQGQAETKNNTAYPVIDIESLNNESFVMLGETQKMQHRLEDVCEEYRLTLNKSVECRSIEAQLAMVKAGMGAAFVPSSITGMSDERKVAFFAIKQNVNGRDIAVIWRKDRYLSDPAKELKSIMKQFRVK